MYYKCLQPQYYVPGKVIDTNVDNYGESFRNEYVDIKKGAKFILNSAKETGLPLSLFYFMLAHANNVPLASNIEIAKVLSGNQNSRMNNDKYSINELVGCSTSSQTVKYETLLEYFNKAKQIDWKFGNNGSSLWEYVGEKIRNEFFPSLPSRLKSYFFVP